MAKSGFSSHPRPDQQSRAGGSEKPAAQPLSPSEQAKLDQIEAGLREGDTAREPAHRATNIDEGGAGAGGESLSRAAGGQAPRGEGIGAHGDSLSALAGGQAPGSKEDKKGFGIGENGESLSELAGGNAPRGNGIGENGDSLSALAGGQAPSDKPKDQGGIGEGGESLSELAGGKAPKGEGIGENGDSLSALAGGKAPHSKPSEKGIGENGESLSKLAGGQAPQGKGIGANNDSLSALAGGKAPGANNPSGGGTGRHKESFLKRNRKWLIAGGGISGLLISLVLGFFALLPLKLTTILKTIEKHEVARVDDYVSRRVDAVLFRYLYHSLTDTQASDGYYRGNGIIRTTYGNLRLNNFEKKLAEKGISVTKSGPRSISFVSTPGATPVDFDSPEGFVKYMNTDLKGRQASKAIKLIVNDTYHPLQFLRRRHMRKYIMNAYNIRKWHIKKQEETKDANNPDMPGSTMLAVQSRVIDPPADLTANSIDCVFGAPCPDPNVRSNPDGTSKFLPGTLHDRNAGEQEGIDNTKKGIRDGYKAMKESTTKALTAGLSKIVGTTIAKSVIQRTPLVGWLALAADLDHFFWNGTLIKIGIMLNSAQYASVAVGWASLADQAKAGELTASQINQLNTALNDLEKSNAMQRIVFNNPDGGEKLADNKRVGSDELGALPPSEGFPGCDVGWLSGNLSTSPPPGAAYWTFMYRQANAFPLGAHTPLCVLRAGVNTLASLINFFIGDLVNFMVESALVAINTAVKVATGDPDADIMVYAQNGIIWIASQIWTPVVSGRETGAALGNAIDAGWDVSANQMCRDALGCKNISNAVSYEQQMRIAAENRADLASQGLLANLFNTESPQAIGSQLVVMMPATPSSAMDKLDGVAFALASNPIKFFGNIATRVSAPAYAADPNRSPNGVQQTGFDAAEMADPELHVATQDIAGPPGPDGAYTPADGRVDQYDCPQITDANQPNQCLIDTAAAQILCASLSADDDGGLGSNGTPGDCGDSDTNTVAYLGSGQPTDKPTFFDNLQAFLSVTLNWSSR